MLGLAGEMRLLPRLLFCSIKASSATADSGPWLKRVPHRIALGAHRKSRISLVNTRLAGSSFQKKWKDL